MHLTDDQRDELLILLVSALGPLLIPATRDQNKELGRLAIQVMERAEKVLVEILNNAGPESPTTPIKEST